MRDPAHAFQRRTKAPLTGFNQGISPQCAADVNGAIRCVAKGLVGDGVNRPLAVAEVLTRQVKFAISGKAIKSCPCLRGVHEYTIAVGV